MNLRSKTLWLAIALAFSAGWNLSQWRTQRNQAVHAQNGAQSDAAALYQMQTLSGQSALTLYYPDSQTIYVYPSVAVGNNYLSCAFSFKLGKAGEPIRRDQCPVTTLK
jgi:lipopolysaccharide export system protein LptC